MTRRSSSSRVDYWFYEHCKYVPRGYFQPLYLALLKKPLAADLKTWLERGYKLAVPRAGDDIVATSLSEFLPELPRLDMVETPNFQVYRVHRSERRNRGKAKRDR